jgi:cytochrome c oxidase assembly protein subunit 15
MQPASMSLAADNSAGESRRGERAVAAWLLLCCAMIFAAVVIGGVTRLTESGLSITEWRPVTGTLPPLSEAEWQAAFALYRQIPQYSQVNLGMDLTAFKQIYWWEYVHRLWGRLIGVAFAVPFLYFLIRRRLPRRLAPHLAALFVLGGAQGALGWYMVQSGLADRIDVSQYRLAAHLSLALAIYAYMLWLAFGLLRRAEPPGAMARAPRGQLWFVAAWTAATIVFGAFVAGLNGGFLYNTFPLMGGQLVPPDLLHLQPAWLNLFDNPAAAQFVHRWLAILLVLLVVALWLRARRLSAPQRRPFDLLLVAVLAQAVLGIATLLLVVPIPLAAAHQAGAVLLLTALVWALHRPRGRAKAPDFRLYNHQAAR